MVFACLSWFLLDFGLLRIHSFSVGLQFGFFVLVSWILGVCCGVEFYYVFDLVVFIVCG